MFKRGIIDLFLVWTICFAGWGFACSKKQVDVFCQDFIDVTASAELEVIKAFPDLKESYAKLKTWSKEICDAIAKSANLKAKELMRQFIPVFEMVVAQIGKVKYLALIDIALHVVLNHIPTDMIFTSANNSAVNKDSEIIRYKSKVSWGCDFYPEKCK